MERSLLQGEKKVVRDSVYMCCGVGGGGGGRMSWGIVVEWIGLIERGGGR